MDKYGVKSTHEAIKNKLMDYISTVYLGKNDSLRAACMTELKDTGILYQKPYIEANHAYLSIPDGIETANLPADVKTILREMIGRNLGVFKNPYRHQIDSLENYYAGKDLFVSTGTGSGKTECFMWPIASKLVMEQINSPDTWKIRGIRTIMLYPMNALVSDQMSRLLMRGFPSLACIPDEHLTLDIEISLKIKTSQKRLGKIFLGNQMM